LTAALLLLLGVAVNASSIPPIAPADQEPDSPKAETLSDEATAVAKQLCRALTAGDLQSAGEIFAPKFAYSGLGEGDAAAFLATLSARYANAAVIRRCKLKPFQFTVNRAHDRAVARMVFIVGGLDRSGARLVDQGDVDVELVRRGKALSLSRLEFLPRKLTLGGVPTFTDVTRDLGLDSNLAEPPARLETLFGGLLNGGLTVADYDGDGDLDIYVPINGANLLYRNDGNGHFTEVAKQAGVADPGDSRASLFVDLDGDGDLDLVVANFARPGNHRGLSLYRNDGHGHFTDRTAQAHLGQVGSFTTLAAADVDGDGRIDLYAGQYQRHGKAPLPSALLAHNGRPNLLLRNLGGLRFQDVAREVGVAGHEWTLASALGDLDGDRRPDLVVVNDFGTPQLFQNLSSPGKIRFSDVTAGSGLIDPGNGMGIDLGDYDGDGRLDVSLSKMYSTAANRLLSQALRASPESLALARNASRGNSLFHNDGQFHFSEVGEQAGIRRAGWAWSCEFGDVENDGDLDLVVASGFHTGQREDEL